MGTKHKVTSAYHPQSNGLVKNTSKSIEQIIQKNMYDNEDNWLELLDSVLFAMRVSKHTSIGYSPFRFLYGHEPILPFQMEDNIMQGNPVPPTLPAAFNNVVVDGIPDDGITVDGDTFDGITTLYDSISPKR